MMGNFGRAALGLAATLCLAAAPALAQDNQNDDSLKGYVAAGIGMMPEYPGSAHYEPTPYFDFRLNQGNYYLRYTGQDLRANLIDSDEFHAGPLIGIRLGRGDVADPLVSRLFHIKDSLTAGGFFEWEHDHKDPRAGETATFLVADNVTGHDTGWTAVLRGVVRRPVEFVDPGLIASVEADATWASENYMQSYFAVTPAESLLSTLPVYHASSGLESAGVGLSLDQFLSRTWSVGLRFHYARLTNAAEESPVTRLRGSPDQFFVGLVVGYVI